MAEPDSVERIAELLTEAGELHHAVYRRSNGEDADWPLWYAGWLVELSELPEVLVRRPTKTELAWLLVQLDREAPTAAGQEAWQTLYAPRIAEHFGLRNAG